jgi:flagellar M-ring protein FliF
VVGVNVELDPDINSETKKITVDPQPTALESNTYRKTSESKPAVGGRPGAVPNEVPSNAPRDITTISHQESTLDENREQQTSVAGHEETVRRKAPLIPTMVTASIWLPKSYFKTLWHQQNPTAEGEDPKVPDPAELEAIEKEVTTKISESIVRTLPPPGAGESPFPQVHVSTYDDAPLIPIEPPATSATALAWLADNWQTIGLLLVGLASLLILRSMIRSTTPTPEAAPVVLSHASPLEEADEEEPEAEQVMLQRRSSPTGASLREELTAMVREDPDAAANVLRTWIGDAA